MPDPVFRPDSTLLYRRLAEIGLSLIPLAPGGKNPTEAAWSTNPKYTPDDLLKVLRPDNNVGIRTGINSNLVNGDYLIALDLDISSAEHKDQAYAKLKELCPFYTLAIEVKSGSSLGLSRHFILTCDKPPPSKRLFDSEEQVTLVTSAFPNGKVKSAYQIDLFSNGRQFVAAGSVHPDGGIYQVVNSNDLDLFIGQVSSKTRATAFIDTETLSQLAYEPVSPYEAEIAREERTADNLKDILKRLPPTYSTGYDTWLQTAMALHWQTQGSEVGLGLFQLFSSTAPNYDPQACTRTWRSIKDRKGGKNVTLSSLIDVGNKYQDIQAFVKEVLDGQYTEEDVQWIATLEREPVKEGSRAKVGLPLVKPTAKNLACILSKDKRFKGAIAYNSFSNQIVLKDSIPALVPGMFPMTVVDKVNGDNWTDSHDLNLLMFFQSKSKGETWYLPKIFKSTIIDAVFQAAKSNEFHPIRDYLRDLTWDGTPRLSNLFSNYLGSDDNAYTREVSEILLVSAVARAFEPGCKSDSIVIIEGPQGIGKSQFVAALSHNKKWGAEIQYHGGVASAKTVEAIAGKHIIELGELSGMKSGDQTELKNFLSTTTDRCRLPYERRAVDLPRQGIFIGTTNASEYLSDTTGNRRWLPVVARSIDIPALMLSRDQLWAEAVVKYDELRLRTPKDQSIYIGVRGLEAKSIMEEIHADKSEDSFSDATFERTQAWLKDKDKRIVSSPELWLAAMGMPADKYGKSAGHTVTAIMRNMPGWKPMGKQRVASGGFARLWCLNDGNYYQAVEYRWNGEATPSTTAARAGI